MGMGSIIKKMLFHIDRSRLLHLPKSVTEYLGLLAGVEKWRTMTKDK